MSAKSRQGCLTQKTTSKSKSTISLAQPGTLQRTCACGGAAGLAGKCETCASQRLSGQWGTIPSGEEAAGAPEMAMQMTGIGGYRFQNLAIQPRQPMGIQAKLTIGQPNDQYEQEADRVADQVMRMPDPMRTTTGQVGSPAIQRLCPECEEDLQRQPQSVEEDEEKKKQLQTQRLQRQGESVSEDDDEKRKRLQMKPLQQPMESALEEEDEEEKKQLQMKPMSGPGSEASPNLQARITNLQQGGGQPLSVSDRAFLEPRFGQDFSRVRLHTDAQAAEMARSVNARAFTVGRDVVFGAGQYQPRSSEGQRLLAHELSHVVQQTGGEQYGSNFSYAITPSMIQRACQNFPDHTDPDTYCETAQEARARITRACPPYRDDFLYRDGPPTHPWRPIPGYGCAHYVAHRLGITNGPAYARCRGGFSVTIDQVTQGRTQYSLAQAQPNDIWSSGVHSGVVTEVDTTVPRVRVDQCGVGGNAQQVWYRHGDVFR